MLRVSSFRVPLLAGFRVALLAACLSFLCMPFAAKAQGAISGRHVTDIGCQQANCYVTFDGAAAPGLPGTTCAAASSEFRWDGTTPAGKLTYSSLLTAFVSGKTVMVYYNACYAPYNGTYPTIEYFHLAG